MLSTLDKNQLVDDILGKGFHIIDGFLHLKHYQNIKHTLHSFQNNDEFKPAKVGHHQQRIQNNAIRRDQICWLDKSEEHPALNEYFNKIDSIKNIFNETLFLGLVAYDAHFAIYQPDGFYKKHVDQFSSANDRRISCVYYLNDDWQETFGGELRLYDKADQLISNILPLSNRFVCFNSDMAHEVSTAYRTRYSIAAWLKVRPMQNID